MVAEALVDPVRPSKDVVWGSAPLKDGQPRVQKLSQKGIYQPKSEHKTKHQRHRGKIEEERLAAEEERTAAEE